MLGATASMACERIPSGEIVWVRLITPVSTYSAKVGDPVQAVLTEEVVCGGETIFPVGSHVQGTVQAVRKVGFGIRHETASLRLGFDEVSPVLGETIPITAGIVTVDNAREQVSNGVIHGIQSTYTPQGRITSRLKYLPSLNPYPDIGLLVFKATFPIFPEPEIYLPAGAELELKLTAPVAVPPTVAWAEPNRQMALEPDPELASLMASLPARSTTTAMVIADIVNLAFIGSREQLYSAFTNAGWQTSSSFSRHTFTYNFYAFLNNSGYPQAPMRPFLLEGKIPEMSWEKSLNSYARRDHLRIWEWSDSSGTDTLWLSSATHDSSASLSVKYHRLLHHIDADIDEERAKVIRDLNAAGCVQSVTFVPRHNVANLSQNATGDAVRTDGAIAVVRLQDCHAAVPELASTPELVSYKPGNKVFRYFRREVLTLRSDLWRSNIIYAGYDLTRMSIHALKHRSATVAAGADAKPATQTAGIDHSLTIVP
jgi:hypothetical protein